jgi:Trypsin-co-occurring domain 1
MKVVSSQSEDGSSILIEVDPEQLETLAVGSGLVGGTAGVEEKAADKLREISDAIAEVCRDVSERVRAAVGAAAPDELGLEFGVTLAGEAGFAVITKASAEATMKVTATWKFDQAAGSGSS